MVFFLGTKQTALDGDKAKLIHSYSSQNNSHTKVRNRRLKTKWKVTMYKCRERVQWQREKARHTEWPEVREMSLSPYHGTSGQCYQLTRTHHDISLTPRSRLLYSYSSENRSLSYHHVYSIRIGVQVNYSPWYPVWYNEIVMEKTFKSR